MTDTINDLLDDEAWIAKLFFRMHWQDPPSRPLLDEKSCHPVRELCVTIENVPGGKANIYMDSIKIIVADIKNNLQRIIKTFVTVMHTVVADNTIIKETRTIRINIVADDKMEAKGAAEERKIHLS